MTNEKEKDPYPREFFATSDRQETPSLGTVNLADCWPWKTGLVTAVIEPLPSTLYREWLNWGADPSKSSEKTTAECNVLLGKIVGALCPGTRAVADGTADTEVTKEE